MTQVLVFFYASQMFAWLTVPWFLIGLAAGCLITWSSMR